MELNRGEHITGSCIATAVQCESPQITVSPLNSLSSLQANIKCVFSFNVTYIHAALGLMFFLSTAFSAHLPFRLNYMSSNCKIAHSACCLKQSVPLSSLFFSLSLFSRNKLIVSVCGFIVGMTWINNNCINSCSISCILNL